MNQFNESERYLGVVVAVYRERSTPHGGDYFVINQFNDGFGSKYYFQCERDYMKHGQFGKGTLVTFKIQRSNDDFYRYSAHSLKEMTSDDDFIQTSISDVKRPGIRDLCLVFNLELLKMEAEKNLMLLGIDYKFFDRWNPQTLLVNILENSTVFVDTWTRKRPGNDDSWGASFRSNFGIYNNDFHSYLKKFAFNKESFYDSGYTSCYAMIDKYKTSNAFKEDQELAEDYTQNLRDCLRNEYDFEEHRKAYFNKVAAAENEVLRNLCNSISTKFNFAGKELDFYDSYDFYLEEAIELIKGMLRPRTDDNGKVYISWF